MFDGIVVNKGLAISETFVKKINNIKIEFRPISNIEREYEKVDMAREEIKLDLEDKYEKTRKLLGDDEADIYKSYLHTLNTSILVGQVKKDIQEQGANAEYVLNKIRKKYVNMYANVDDVFLKRKSDSIQYIVRMMILVIMNFDTNNLSELENEKILVTKNISKNDYLKLDGKMLKGIILEDSAKYAYAKILGESLNIPVIVGVKDASKKIKSAQNLILDCSGLGSIIIEPKTDELEIYTKMLQFNKNMSNSHEIIKIVREDDDRLCGAILNKNELEKDLDINVGFVSTEFSYIGKSEVPKFEDLLADYTYIYENEKTAKNLIFRALNMGGEHDYGFAYTAKEKNPIMGLRGVKWLLANRDLMVNQLAAILKASDDKTANIAFTNLTSYEQMLEVKIVLEEAKIVADVSEDKDIRVGVIIDAPATAILLNAFVEDIDFAVIDSTRLTELLKGVDKNNKYSNDSYDVLCPSVISFIFDTIQRAHDIGIFISITGDITKDTKNFPLLLGMGVDQIITEERQNNQWWYIYKTEVKHWREVVKKCIGFKTSHKVSMLINEEISKILDL